MRTELFPDLGRAATRRALILGGVGAATLIATPGNAEPQRSVRSETPWTGTWTTAPTAAAPGLSPIAADTTVRQVVHLSLGGDQPRIRLTNEYGTEAVHLGEVWTGVRAGGPNSSAMWPATIRPVTFGGAAEVVLKGGESRVSDPIPNLSIAPGDDLVISFHLPERTLTGTLSPRSFQINHLLAGNFAAAPFPAGGANLTRYVLLGGVSVRTAGPSSAVVAFGDSITCGTKTTVSANQRWPDLLAARIRAGGLPRGVLNAGIGGNQLLTGAEIPVPAGGGAGGQSAAEAASVGNGPAGLRRFDHDVLAQPGVAYVITLIGVNDIGHGAGADALIAGHRELIARGRAAGLRVYGGTLLPFAGSLYDRGHQRGVRTTLNRWIREGGEFDAVVDFDAAVRDGTNPERLWAGFDGGDHLHLNDTGMLALASAVPLELLR
ncbi:SGNH/GDSL hydrolase family protein [Actinoplanes sp. L3-i22]|uniref:SGNH/GDSL hydrolase family protein n=1 Tax=Actinoplanes sp. L3-i22 TaxID=2836373 RepID=UPI001C75D8D8|nr:SGNH/GDSL hydrolase family protein [Actinoplanes sp. L3-i22]BCY07730.1 SGNH hydrolase [Actinoplanes sp. L3-i22]